MRRAGFRVLGFGIESFSLSVLREFNKAQIYPHIEPMLRAALEAGITPFLDLILTSPRCELQDLAETLREAYRWLQPGCEIGMYPYVIPFSGAALRARCEPRCRTRSYARQRSRRHHDRMGTAGEDSAARPAATRGVILRIERDFETHARSAASSRCAHLPSRVRSLCGF